MPKRTKNPIVTPILMKAQDKENIVNYRSVSNLQYIRQLIDKVAVKQPDTQLTDENIHEPLQS